MHLRPEEQVSETLRLSSFCTRRRRIRFLESAPRERDCSLSSPWVSHLLPLPEAIAADFFTGFYIVMRTVLATSTTRSSSTSSPVRNRLYLPTALKHKRTKISVEELIESLDVKEKARAKDTKGGEGHSVANTVQNQRNQGKGKGKFKPNKSTNFKKKKNKAELPCFMCGEFGHFSKDCPECADRRGKRGGNGQSSKTVNTVTASKTGDTGYVIQSFDWWIDTGANVHVISDCSVLMGNGSAASVLGTGTVDLKFTSGNIIQLKNVQHVPSMNKNLVSGSLLLRDGFKTRKPHKAVEERNLASLELIHSDLYEMNGVFTKGGKRVPNRNKDKTPYEEWIERKPSLSYIRTWGCLAKVNVPINKKRKLGPKTITPKLNAPTEVFEPPREIIPEEDNNEAPRNNKRQRVEKSFDIDVINEVKFFLSTKFDMKDLREADVILNIKLIKDESGITLSQTHYVEKVLSQFGYIDSKPSPTPYDPSVTLKKNKRIGVNQLKYSQIIGSLIYLASATRPDISFAVSKLSRHPAVLEEYSDANWISDDEIYVTSEYVFMLGSGAVSWRSYKQTILTRLTIEAKLAALDTASVEGDWLRELLMDLSVVEKPIPAILMNCDNQTAIAKVNSDKENTKSSRHVRRRVKSVKKMRHSGVISVTYIQTEKNLADPLQSEDAVLQSILERTHLYELDCKTSQFMRLG
ncbi:hypothetical protein U9M48_001500 [Paspalum notatum var. saurae]|uniref:CCHC-type domain-containing protein n=1 Tax=Paspalum notatum var. saurae TaxID=547442 RepID=A0AAQ3PNQ3_PASNO